MAPAIKIVRVKNCIPSRDRDKDWLLDTALAADIVSLTPALPESVDLREDWWTVGNQEQTGSCVGWAAADGVLRWHFVKAGKLATNERVSVRYVWMAAKETDEFVSRPTGFIELAGTSLKAALDVSRKFGVVVDAVLPWDNLALYQGDVSSFYATASARRISSYYSLRSLLTSAVNFQKHLKLWLAKGGPVLTRLTVDKTFDKATNGILDIYKPYPPGDPRAGGHAVTIVGYTATDFIVRNSWGTSWGDQGFGYASYKYAYDAFSEAYGVRI